MSTPSSPSTATKPAMRVRGVRAGADAASLSGEDLPQGLRCEYPSKFCNNHKAHKEKGGLHKFCDFHREKANQNQKRWQQRRRDARDQQRMKNSARTAAVGVVAKTVEDLGPVIQCVSSPTDFIEPFPLNDFSTMTPPHNAYSTQVYAPAVSFMAGLDPAFQYPFGFPEGDPMVDMASTIMFNDPAMANFHSYNWPMSKVESGLESFTVTGFGGAIV